MSLEKSARQRGSRFLGKPRGMGDAEPPGAGGGGYSWVPAVHSGPNVFTWTVWDDPGGAYGLH